MPTNGEGQSLQDPGKDLLSRTKELIRSTPFFDDSSTTEIILQKLKSGTGLSAWSQSSGNVGGVRDNSQGKVNEGKQSARNSSAPDAIDGDDDDGSSDGSELQEDGDDSDESQDSDDDYVEDLLFDQSDILEFLGNLQTEIDHKYHHNQKAAAADVDMSVVKDGIRPYPHQISALSAIEAATTSIFKGLILADAPGLGKTLPSLMAIASAKQTGRGPSIVVAPNSCCRQWLAEAKRFLREPFNVLLLLDEDVSPIKIFEYDLVITPYSHITAEVSRIYRYLKQVKHYTGKATDEVPKRPKLTLLSGFYSADVKPWGQYLILDEAHSIKNTKSVGHAAVAMLRDAFETCVMLTGTPFDNTWRDGYGFLQLLRNHPFTTNARYLNTFSEPLERRLQRLRAPSGAYMLRITQLFDSCVLRRPSTVVRNLLPPVNFDTVKFTLSDADLQLSDYYFNEFQAINRKRKNARKAARQRSAQKGPKKGKGKPALACLIKAQQVACHAELLALSRVEQKLLPRSIDPASESSHIELDDNTKHEVDKWLDRLRKDSRWRSARVDVIMSTVKGHQRDYPDDAIIVMDESVLFLSIIEIAFEEVNPKTKTFVYDGRLHATERDAVLQRFKEASSPKVMLMSRAAGGVGLNVQFANVIVQCSPWWKHSWQQQAVGRVHRPGQEKPVFVYQIRAEGCEVELHKIKQSKKKNSVGKAILEAITSHADQTAPSARTIV